MSEDFEEGLDDMDEIDEDVEDEIVELIDEDGKELKFKLLDVTEYKGEKYVLLLPAEPDEKNPEDEVVIFLLDEEKEVLEPIEDDALLEEVLEFYQNEED